MDSLKKFSFRVDISSQGFLWKLFCIHRVKMCGMITIINLGDISANCNALLTKWGASTLGNLEKKFHNGIQTRKFLEGGLLSICIF